MLSSEKSVQGYTTGPVGVGVANHSMLYGHVNVPHTEVLGRMDLFNRIQLLIIIVAIIIIPLIIYIPKLRSYINNIYIIGNSCIDFNKNVVYLWNSECRPIIGNKTAIIKMLCNAAPDYKLSKEDVCQTIWGRDAKSGQALYNVAMSDLRTLFINDDESLELKSIPKEGMQLIVDNSLVERWRKVHFVAMYIKACFQK